MRIHHFTLPAHDPARVAGVLAELAGGKVVPLPHLHQTFIVYAGDEDGTAIEVWPRTARADPGQDHPDQRDLPLPEAWPHHAYVSIDADADRILEVFAREGWKAQRVQNGPPGGGGFELVRGWIENQMCIELASPVMREQYEAFFRRAAAR